MLRKWCFLKKERVSVSPLASALFVKIILRFTLPPPSLPPSLPSSQIDELYEHVSVSPEYNQRCVEKASPPTVTSEAILHALTSEYPQTRYVVANVDGKRGRERGRREEEREAEKSRKEPTTKNT